MIASPFEIVVLFDILRCGLASLTPVMERAGIPWQEGDAYDDWEKIASTLYQQILINTVRSTNELPACDLDFPDYDLIQPSYEGKVYFEVIHKSEATPLGPFVGFSATDSQFANVKYALEDSEGNIDMTTTGSFPFEDCELRLRLPGAGNKALETLTMSD